MNPIAPLPWTYIPTSNGVAYKDANGLLVSFPENHAFIWFLVEKYQGEHAVKEALKQSVISDD